MAIFTYQQLLQHLHSGEQQLSQFQQFCNKLGSLEVNLQILEEETVHLDYYKTVTTLIQWLDWFLTETGYEESALIQNVKYINRRLITYPAIELDIEQRS